MHEHERKRLRVISIIVIGIALMYIGRLYYLGIMHGAEFAREADKQYVSSVPEIYDRGTIYFREKTGKLVAAATLASGYLISVSPKDIGNAEAAYEKMSMVVPIDRTEFMAKMAKKDDTYEEILKRVPEEKMKELKALGIPSLRAYREAWRYYPAHSLASSVLGFVGYNGDELSGRYGLEAYYNDTLKRNEENLYVNFFAELFHEIGSTIFDRGEQEAGDLVLTIEPSVQAYLEEELGSVMKEWRSDETGGIIMDPKSGAILAMGINPAFDPNEYGKEKHARVFSNPSIQDVYEMGSIVKPITMAAGIDAGVVSANTLYNDTGSVTLNNKTFGNWDGKARGPGTSMQQVLNDSLNTGVSFVVSKLGNKEFAEYIQEKFALGEETGVDLPGERQGLMTNLLSKRDLEYANASFGQGFAVSPINMCSALAVLGNGGYLVSPHVVDEIRYESGKVKKYSPNPMPQAIKKETSEEITRMLVNVVDKALLGGTVKVPEYSIAAKTGTAQIARPRELGGGYYDDRYFHTFFGYFPAYDPKFIVFLYTYYPKEAKFASHTLTMPFIRTAKFLLHYYSVPPDRSDVKSITLGR
jgi:stage V sporulation protein D (sporulation-specific penicillin-binding protein)